MMLKLGSLSAVPSFRYFMPERMIRPSGSRVSVITLALASLLDTGGCTAGSPGSLAIAPDFEVSTPAGIASVSIREPLPGMTRSEFERLVRMGMERAQPAIVLPGPVEPPFPRRRILWHVNPNVAPGSATLVVNIFDGSGPVTYQQAEVSNTAPASTIAYTIESVTRRLITAYMHHRDKKAPANAPAAAVAPG